MRAKKQHHRRRFPECPAREGGRRGRWPGAWPPSATGRGTGPAGDKFPRSGDAGNGGRVRSERQRTEPPATSPLREGRRADGTEGGREDTGAPAECRASSRKLLARIGSRSGGASDSFRPRNRPKQEVPEEDVRSGHDGKEEGTFITKCGGRTRRRRGYRPCRRPSCGSQAGCNRRSGKGRRRRCRNP